MNKGLFKIFKDSAQNISKANFLFFTICELIKRIEPSVIKCCYGELDYLRKSKLLECEGIMHRPCLNLVYYWLQLVRDKKFLDVFVIEYFFQYE
jgi:hypothetical protein